MAQIDLATYVAKVEFDNTGLQKGLNQVDSEVGKSVGNTQKKTSMATRAIQVAITAATAKLAKEVINIGASFESGMSEVQAISGATGEDLDRLTEKAKEMGRNTKFSATEASEGLKYMAMAGWDTNDMLDGLDGVMMLAAASGEDLALVSDIVTDALSGFGMEAHQASEFADLLASTSSNSNTNVAMLGESFKYVAPLAGALGYSAEDTALALGLMANAGIKGSQAGTTLRNIMTGLTTPTKASAESMAELGLEVTNADGSMRPFNEVLVDMREKFDELTPAQKAQHAQAIAGKQGMAGLLAIMEASPEEFDKLIDATTEYNGVAEEMSELMEDNLQGDLNKLRSALEGLAIDIYEGITPALRELTQGFTETVGVLEGIIELLGVQFGAAFTLMSGEIEEFIEENRERINEVSESWEESKESFKSSWLHFFNSIRDTAIDNVDSIGETFLNMSEISSNALELVGHALELFGLAIELVAPIVFGFAEIVSHAFNDILKVVTKVVDGVMKEIREWVSENEEELTEMRETVQEITDGIKQIWDKVTQAIGKILKAFGKSSNITTKGIMDKIKNTIKTQLEFINNFIKLILAVISGDWEGAWNAIKRMVEIVWNAIKTVVSKGIEGVKNGLKGAYGGLKSIAKGLFNKIWESAKEIFKSLISWLPNQISKIFTAFTSRYSKARSAGKGMFSAVWDGMKGIWSSLSSWVSSKVSWLTDKLLFWRRSKNEMNSGGGGSAPRFATGTPLITKDTPAILHKGEAVIPASLNPFNPKNTTVGGFWNGKFGQGGNGGSANYNVQIDIDRVESDVDIERAVAKGIEQAESKRKSRLRRKGY